MSGKPGKRESVYPPGVQKAPGQMFVSRTESNVSISFTEIISPADLEAYEKNIPGFKDEFFRQWKSAYDLRQETTRAEIEIKKRASFSASFTSIFVTTTISLLLLGVLGMAFFLVYQGAYQEAVALIGGVMGIGIFGNYLAGKIKQ
jgi:hypothetical protein